MSARGGARAPAAGGGPVWFLDLDDTLHDASHAMFAVIDARMTDFVQERLAISRERADALRRAYWRRYGATVLGLERHHGVDAGAFLRAAHDFDVGTRLRREPGLAALVRRLAGRKVLLSNAPLDYAARVLRGIGLHRAIRTRYGVERMRLHGTLRPKPARSLLRAVLVREGLAGRTGARRAVLVDDSLANLKAARAVGFATILVERGTAPGARRLRGRAFVDARVRTVRRLAALAARLGLRQT